MKNKYTYITFDCYNVDQLIAVYKTKYEKDYQLIGYRLREGKASITLYPKEGKERLKKVIKNG